MSLFLTFAPTADGTIRTFLPKEIRLALRSHSAIFYTGGLVLSVTSSIPTSPAFIFQTTLFTLLCLEHNDQVPTPTEKPRKASEVTAGLNPQGYAPWLHYLLARVTGDIAEGARPLPLLRPALVA